MFVAYENMNGRISGKKKKFKKKVKINSLLTILKKIIQNTFNDRSYWVDIILLVIIFEWYYDRVILAEYIFYIIILKNFLIFVGGFYLCFFKIL